MRRFFWTASFLQSRCVRRKQSLNMFAAEKKRPTARNLPLWVFVMPSFVELSLKTSRSEWRLFPRLTRKRETFSAPTKALTAFKRISDTAVFQTSLRSRPTVLSATKDSVGRATSPFLLRRRASTSIWTAFLESGLLMWKHSRQKTEESPSLFLGSNISAEQRLRSAGPTVFSLSRGRFIKTAGTKPFLKSFIRWWKDIFRESKRKRRRFHWGKIDTFGRTDFLTAIGALRTKIKSNGWQKRSGFQPHIMPTIAPSHQKLRPFSVLKRRLRRFKKSESASKTHIGTFLPTKKERSKTSFKRPMFVRCILEWWAERKEKNMLKTF